MNGVFLFLNLAKNHLKKLCQHKILLAALLVFCLIFSLFASFLGNLALKGNLDFSGLKLGIVGEKELANWLKKMKDVASYCEITAYEKEEEALQDLKEAKIDGILILPSDFVSLVMNDENPDVKLLIKGDRPLETLLLTWLGQNAQDLLASCQAGIYAVMRTVYQKEQIDYDRLLVDVNLAYIQFALGRSDTFNVIKIERDEILNTKQHYFCGIFLYLLLICSVFYTDPYDETKIFYQKRLKALGFGSFLCFNASLFSLWLFLFPFCLAGNLACLLLGEANMPNLIFYSLLLSFFLALKASFFRLLGGNKSFCGILALLFGSFGLFLSGGIIPLSLLPQSLKNYVFLSPFTGFRNIMANSLEFKSLLVLIIYALLEYTLCSLLYDKSFRSAKL